MQKEVHVEQTEENPVVSRILEDVHKWHRIIAESVNQYCFKLSLYVVQKYHENTKLLVKSVNRLFAVDFLLE